MDLFFMKPLIKKVCLHNFRSESSCFTPKMCISSRYGDHLKRKHGLVYNSLHVEIKICVGQTVDQEWKGNHLIEIVSILE